MKKKVKRKIKDEVAAAATRQTKMKMQKDGMKLKSEEIFRQ